MARMMSGRNPLWAIVRASSREPSPKTSQVSVSRATWVRCIVAPPHPLEPRVNLATSSRGLATSGPGEGRLLSLFLQVFRLRRVRVVPLRREVRHVGVAVQLVFDCKSPDALARFWAEVLGYKLQDPPRGYDTWEDGAR